MDDLLDLERIVAAGVRANAFRDSAEYRNAVQAVGVNLVGGLMNTTDEPARLTILRHLDALQAIDAQIRNVIEDGVLAEHELEKLKDGSE